MSNFNHSSSHGAYTVDGAKLTIHETDSAEGFYPPQDVENKTKGIVRWYRLEERDSKVSKRWRDTLANELCKKFLLLDGGGQVKFTLTDFPAGYHLYTDHIGTGAVYDDVRRDSYLIGGPHKFRSPQEALCHFAWLMSGKPPDRCRCIYDDKTWKRKQTALNKAMADEWQSLLNDRAKKRFEALQRHEDLPVSTSDRNEASFIRPNNGLSRMS